MSYSINVVEPRKIESDDLKAVLDYWEQARGKKFAPTYGSEFCLEDIPPEIVPCCTVVDVIDGGEDFKYRFWGTQNVTIKGFEMSGRRVSECTQEEFVSYGLKQFREVMNRKAPTAFFYLKEYKNLQNRKFISARFPLSSDGETIEKIFSWQNLIDKSEQSAQMFDSLNDPQKVQLLSVLAVC